MADDLHALGAVALGAAYRRRSLSPVEVTEAILARIDRLNPGLEAFCLVDAEAALQAARASEARHAAGTPLGPLDGVPATVKDLLLARGWPTRRGSHSTDPAAPAAEDAPCVAGLRAAGAVLLGKTTTPEFGWKWVTDNPLGEVARNPWDRTRTAGGSSGGGAAAAAAGLGPLHTGTDGGGSVRIPCAFCGVVGLKPSYGRVPVWPASLFSDVSHVGPMARSVMDAALMLDAMAVPDARDVRALPPPEGRFADALGVPRPLRIAFSPDLGFVQVDPEVAALTAAAVERLRTAGVAVADWPHRLEDPADLFRAHWHAGAALLVRGVPEARRDRIDPGLLRVAEDGARMGLMEYLAAQQRRMQAEGHLAALFQEIDILITPAMPLVAFEAGRLVPEGRSPDDDWVAHTGFTYPFNLSQQPAAVVPCGRSVEGLPVALQLVGRRHDDAGVLAAAALVERILSPEPELPPL